jgi:hypothetical protein
MSRTGAASTARLATDNKIGIHARQRTCPLLDRQQHHNYSAAPLTPPNNVGSPSSPPPEFNTCLTLATLVDVADNRASRIASSMQVVLLTSNHAGRSPPSDRGAPPQASPTNTTAKEIQPLVAARSLGSLSRKPTRSTVLTYLTSRAPPPSCRTSEGAQCHPEGARTSEVLKPLRTMHFTLCRPQPVRAGRRTSEVPNPPTEMPDTVQLIELSCQNSTIGEGTDW